MKEKYKYKEFYIKKFSRYYIYKLSNNKIRYLHRDLTLDDICGSANFFNSIDECQKYIDKYIDMIECLHNKYEFLSKSEMLIC